MAHYKNAASSIPGINAIAASRSQVRYGININDGMMGQWGAQQHFMKLFNQMNLAPVVMLFYLFWLIRVYRFGSINCRNNLRFKKISFEISAPDSSKLSVMDSVFSLLIILLLSASGPFTS
uniref:hypothetical protein n=1 Tax=Escherichia coli TaxID=562 RepID=UPI001F415FE2|nr:hypothetical protein [Escherichia coli]UGK56398.1 hypothetical protein [Escherichia coli]